MALLYYYYTSIHGGISTVSSMYIMCKMQVVSVVSATTKTVILV